MTNISDFAQWLVKEPLRVKEFREKSNPEGINQYTKGGGSSEGSGEQSTGGNHAVSGSASGSGSSERLGIDTRPSRPKMFNSTLDKVKGHISRSELEDSVKSIRSGEAKPTAEAQRLVRDTPLKGTEAFQSLARYLDSEYQSVRAATIQPLGGV